MAGMDKSQFCKDLKSLLAKEVDMASPAPAFVGQGPTSPSEFVGQGPTTLTMYPLRKDSTMPAKTKDKVPCKSIQTCVRNARLASVGFSFTRADAAVDAAMTEERLKAIYDDAYQKAHNDGLEFDAAIDAAYEAMIDAYLAS